MVILKGVSLVALWASTVTATPFFLRSLESRDANCGSKHTSLNGLNFTTYCNTNNPFNDARLPPDRADSFEECMELCSRFWNGALSEGCFGVVWKEDKSCWMRNSTTGTGNFETEQGTYSALVDRKQMKPLDTDCPFPDRSEQSIEGIPEIKYTVHCNKDIGGAYDTAWKGYPSNHGNPFQAFYHAESLSECVGYCVKEHPLCMGVIYNPGLEIGYANCWPKTGFDQNIPLTSPSLNVTHSATFTTITTPDQTCLDEENYTSTSDDSKNFAIHCKQANQGTNMTMLHKSNFTSCMEECATNKKGCVGVVYDSKLQGGFDNCYLQNTSSVFSDVGSSMYGVVSGAKPVSSNKPSSSGSPNGNSTSGSNDSPSSSNDSSSSKAWIAGPVVGGILALGLIGAAVWFFRRRKSRAAAAAAAAAAGPSHNDKHDPYGGAPAPAYAPVPQYASHNAPPSELGEGVNHQVNEADGTPAVKYALKGGATTSGREGAHEMAA